MDAGRRRFFITAGILSLAGLDMTQTRGATRPALASPLPKPNAALKAKRWAMVINTRKISPALAFQIIKACHAAHNMPEILDEKHKVSWIWTDSFKNVFAGQNMEQIPSYLTHVPILALCNHCQSPPCVRVCPTKATFQGPGGIVMMDYHRCIGCRYCMAACPYGARSFNWVDPGKHLQNPNPDYPARMKGVVEKCNFCEDRLAKGLLPACVEQCKNNEMVFGDLADPDSGPSRILRQSFAIRRKPELGTGPQVFYIV